MEKTNELVKSTLLWDYLENALSYEDGVIKVVDQDVFTTIPQTFGFGNTNEDPLDDVLQHIGGYAVGRLNLTEYKVVSGPYTIQFVGEHVNSINDEPAITLEYNGTRCLGRWYKDGKLHRDGDKPAMINRIPIEDFPRNICWYKDGKLHRDDNKPAFIEYWSNFDVNKVRWFKDGVSLVETFITKKGELNIDKKDACDNAYLSKCKAMLKNIKEKETFCDEDVMAIFPKENK